MLRTQSAVKTHAITSVTTPNFLRIGLKYSPMIHVTDSGMVATDFFATGDRGLERSIQAEGSVSGTTIAQ